MNILMQRRFRLGVKRSCKRFCVRISGLGVELSGEFTHVVCAGIVQLCTSCESWGRWISGWVSADSKDHI